MKLLIAPLHYVIDKNVGSEYTRSYYYLRYISSKKNLSGDVLVAYSARARIGDFKIISYLKKKPTYISNIFRIKFIFWIFINASRLLKKNNYNLIWHNGPFSIGETFSLLAIFKPKTIPLVIGPINPPHELLPSDEARSMGDKSGDKDSRIRKIVKNFDNVIYPVVKVFRFLSIKTLSRARLILVFNQKARQIIKQHDVSVPIGIVKKSIDVSDLQTKSKRKTPVKINILSVGYLVERKGMINIAHAIKILIHNRGFRKINLTIIGEGPQKKELFDFIKKNNLTEHIELAGYVPREKVGKYYANSHIFISASISESSIPSVYFEAMSFGLPMVLVRNQATNDLPKSKIAVQIIQNNDPVEIADGLEFYIKQMDKMNHFGNINKRLFNKYFSFQSSMENILKAFNEAL